MVKARRKLVREALQQPIFLEGTEKCNQSPKTMKNNVLWCDETKVDILVIIPEYMLAQKKKKDITK